MFSNTYNAKPLIGSVSLRVSLCFFFFSVWEYADWEHVEIDFGIVSTHTTTGKGLLRRFFKTKKVFCFKHLI